MPINLRCSCIALERRQNNCIVKLPAYPALAGRGFPEFNYSFSIHAS